MQGPSHSLSHHAEPSFRPLLTTLLLLEPSALAPSQLSSDLLMRQRMLGLPSTTPHAYDVEYSSLSLDPSTDDEVTRTQQNFVSRLSRPPFEFSIHSLDVAATAHCLFALRSKARHDAANGDVDPIDLNEYRVWCSEAWHNKPQDAILIQVPGVGALGEPVLWMMLTEGDDGEWKLANLFALDGADHRSLVDQLHCRTEACRRVHRQSRRMQEEQEEEGGAEYINDADDFWDGFSDQEDQGRNVIEAERAGGVSNPTVDLRIGDGSPPSVTAQEAAIKDIIRGAYTLHRSARATGSDQDSEEAFMTLVRSVISTAAS